MKKQRTAVITGSNSGIGLRTAHAVAVDLSNGDEQRGLITKAADALGHVDILVNNAGIRHVAPIGKFPVYM
ncbi:MAG: SDR family NAD(P)-dependent oxidoreductase [Oricola sp.]